MRPRHDSPGEPEAGPGVDPSGSARPAGPGRDVLRREVGRPVAAPVCALSALIRERHGPALQAVLLYGSITRDVGVEEGIVDLLAIVDGYRSAFERKTHAVLNWLLPPNVFYIEAEHEGVAVRSKYAVVSLADFRRYTAPRTFQGYFWARFAQPCRLVYSRDAAATDAVVELLAQAARTFLRRAAVLLPPPFTAGEIWRAGLGASYRTELRAERSGVADRLVAANAAHYEELTRGLAPEMDWPVVETAGAASRYTPALSGIRRFSGRVGWRLRRVQGKFLNFLRLVKGLFTFDGAVDYIAWKIERHSGVKVEISPFARRHPLLGGWKTLWKLWRKGAFR